MNIEKKLRSAWRKKQLFFNAKGLGYLLVCVVGLILANLLIDWLFLLPGYGRVILLLIDIGVLGWILYRQWLCYLERYNSFQIALQIEKKYPELKSALVSYVQLSVPDESSEPLISTQLIEATRRQADNIVKELDFGAIVNFKKLMRLSALAVGAAILFTLVSLSVPRFISILFYRMSNPSANLTYPTRTKIQFITGDVTIRQGEPVELIAQCQGEIPEEGTLFVKFAEGNRERLKFAQGGKRKFTYKFDEVFREFSYYVHLGDATSKTYWVKVVSQPLLIQQKVRLQYPSYTGMKPEEVDSLNLKVPEGTEIQWLLKTDVPLSEASILKEENETRNTSLIPMNLESDGQSMNCTLKAVLSFIYSFRWQVRSHDFLFDDKVNYTVDVIPDAAPEVRIVRPQARTPARAEREKATVGKTLHLTFQATDKYGLKEAWVAYSVNEGAEQKYPLGSLKGNSIEKEVKWKLKDSIPELKEGDEVTCAIEVVDNCEVREPNYSSSDQIYISIVSVDEYLTYIAEKRKLLRQEIESLYEEEDEAHDKVKSLESLSSEIHDGK